MRFNHTLKSLFLSLATLSHAAPISLSAFPHSSFGGPDPPPRACRSEVKYGDADAAVPRPRSPGGSARRSGRAAPPLPYLRGSRWRWRLKGACLQPPGGRQRRKQEEPEGERRHPSALHLGLAGGGAGRTCPARRVGPRPGGGARGAGPGGGGKGEVGLGRLRGRPGAPGIADRARAPLRKLEGRSHVKEGPILSLHPRSAPWFLHVNECVCFFVAIILKSVYSKYAHSYSSVCMCTYL